jgi:hypothetical protein
MQTPPMPAAPNRRRSPHPCPCFGGRIIIIIETFK